MDKTESTRGLGMIDEINEHLFIDHVRLARLSKLAQESIAGLFGDLTNRGEHRSGSQIGYLRGLIEAMSGYFNIELHLLVGEYEPHSNAENDATGCLFRERSQRSDGIDKNPRKVVYVHIPPS